ncbi:hypothetical protein HAX54_011017, partial [Datura stramonium]|nr:hypothetical protein [Datura stramonium]
MVEADDKEGKGRGLRRGGENERSGDVSCGRLEEGDGGDGEREVGLPEIMEVHREVVASAGSGVVHRRRRRCGFA